MRRLFLKIFLWYWLAASATVVVFVVSTWSMQSEQGGPLFLRDISNLMAIHGLTAVEEYERGGPSTLAAYFKRIEPNPAIETFLFDERGSELSGRMAEDRAREFALLALQTGKPEFEQTGGALVGARPITSANGNRYALAARFVGGRPPSGISPAFVVRLVAVLATAGGVCYALALYLTRPVDRLRDATRTLASGDLSVRVMASLGQRRDELTDLGRDFDFMAERLQSFVEAERRLLRDISHELRSPLARLTVALELVRQQCPPDVKPELDRIELEASRLDEMIGQLLTLTRLEGAVLGKERVPVDLAAIVEDVAADADFEARAVDRSVEILASEPCTVLGDDALLRSAVENVVRNAVRYTGEGTSVDVSLAVKSETGSQTAIVRVRDHGPGIPADALDQIFRPFFRVHDGRERQSGGVGLGLAIAHRAVRSHGGEAKAENAPDGGLIVELRIPLDKTVI